MHYQSGDFPAEPLEVDGFDLDPAYTGVSAKLYQEDGQMVADLGYHEFSEDGIALVPFTQSLDNEGVYQVRLNATAPTQPLPRVKALTPLYFVVESSTGNGWHSLNTARHEWQGAPEDDVQLYRLLQVAKSDCQQYASFYTDDTTPPPRALAAQLMQARNTANAIAASPGGDGGPDTFILPQVAMTWKVMALLRPHRVVGAIG